MKKLSIPLFLVLLLASGCQQAQQEPVKVTAGHGIFLNNCVSCHQGDGYPPGPNHVVLNSSYVRSEAQFIRLLRNPTAAGMPPFPKERLSDAEAHELYIYIQTQVNPEPQSTAE